MKKQKNKQGKRASRQAKINNIQEQIITVKNAEGEADTTAEIVVRNQIDYEPKVSVIIPVYNVEKYLPKCLDSVIGQTLSEIEIICVDDGSTDLSFDILKEYAALDKRITVLKQENLYAGVARNAGFALAKGEYLSFLDSDDFFEPNMLEEMYNKAKTDDSDIVVCGYYLYSQTKEMDTAEQVMDKKLLAISPFNPKDAYYYTFAACRATPWTKMIRHSLFTKYALAFERFPSCNDSTCIYTSLAVAQKISVMDKLFVHYRWNTGAQISTTRFGKNEMWVNASAALERNLKRLGIYDDFYTKIKYALSSSLHWETNNKIELLKDISKEKLSPRLYNDLYVDFTNPKVSVIVPVYNVAPYLQECLDSIIGQTLQEIEIICIDDGSTDNSLKILRQYAAKDSRIQILTQFHKKQGAARNLGISKAKGKYIFFCDADDFIKPETLEKLYKKIEFNQADICQYLLCLYKLPDKKVIYRQIDKETFDFARNSKRGVYTYSDNPKILFKCVEPVLKLYRRDFIIENNIKFYENCYFEDTIVHIKSMFLAYKICFDDNVYYYYRQNREGQTTQKNSDSEKFLDIFNYIFEAKDFFQQHRVWQELKQYYYQFALSRMITNYEKCTGNTKQKFLLKINQWLKSENLSELKMASPELFNDFSCILHNKVITKSSTMPRSKVIAEKSSAKAKPTKYAFSFKIFKYIALYTHKKRGGNQVWKILGLPIWRKRKFTDNQTIKYYFLGIPLFEIAKIGRKF